MELATGQFPYKNCKTDFEVLTKVLQEDPPVLPLGMGFSLDFQSFVKDWYTHMNLHKHDILALISIVFTWVFCFYSLTKDHRKRPKYHKLLVSLNLPCNSSIRCLTSNTLYSLLWSCVHTSALFSVGTQFYPPLRGISSRRGGLVPDGDGAHRVSSQQPVLQPSPAPISLQQVARRRTRETEGWRERKNDAIVRGWFRDTDGQAWNMNYVNEKDRMEWKWTV